MGFGIPKDSSRRAESKFHSNNPIELNECTKNDNQTYQKLDLLKLIFHLTELNEEGKNDN